MNIQTSGDLIYLPIPRWRRRGSGGGGQIPGSLSGIILGVSTLSGTLTIIPAFNFAGTISGASALSGTMTGGSGPTSHPTYFIYGF